MKKCKKILAMALSIMMFVWCTTPVLASSREEDELKTTVLYLEENRITDVGNRHIKVTWDEVYGADAYKLEIADNEWFEDATSKKVLPKRQGTYYNFAEVPYDVKDTYYIRIKPCFVYGESDDGYDYVYGQWSNVIVAEYEEKVIDPDKIQNINFFPWIPNIDWNKLKDVDWSEIMFQNFNKYYNK